ncbi:MAG: selenocysteine-specific translation elongation factor [bacterium]|nr:selenocysteine-specific translation elongation factor [bacterium]
MDSQRIILGTAGHIDHGKTTLVRALTGIDTDRLKEEKERGITIELGFAYLDLASGGRLGIVDVPGHERFVRHMVAGATGIDAVMLVVAADEGIMPQTSEHFDICRLLKVQRGMVVVTKIDLVDPEWLKMVIEDIRRFVQGSFLENAPIFPVSATSGQGLEALRKGLEELVEAISPRNLQGICRLPIDRVFTIKGFGTVVTGTLLAGALKKGMSVEIFPSGKQARVRGIQVYNQPVEEALAGQRVAINLHGVDKEELARGDVVSLPGHLQASYLLDGRIALLPSAPNPLKNRTRVRFHAGTSEVLARIILLDREELLPADEALVQFQLESPLALMAKDRFVVRTYSPVITIGGGSVIDNLPARHRRFDQAVLDGLRVLEGGDNLSRLELIIRQAHAAGTKGIQLSTRLNLDQAQVAESLEHLQKKQRIVMVDPLDQWVIHQDIFQSLLSRAIDILTGFHRRFALKAGMSREELKARLQPDLDARLYNKILATLLEQGKIVIQEKTLRLSWHQVRLTPEEERQKAKILDICHRAGFQPPSIDEVMQQTCQGGLRGEAANRLIQHLIDEGLLVKLKEGLLFHQQALAQIQQQLEGYLQDKAQISVAEFKDLFGFSRKYAIALLEYFDSINLTMRLGDKRILKKRREAP